MSQTEEDHLLEHLGRIRADEAWSEKVAEEAAERKRCEAEYKAQWDAIHTHDELAHERLFSDKDYNEFVNQRWIEKWGSCMKMEDTFDKIYKLAKAIAHELTPAERHANEWTQAEEIAKNILVAGTRKAMWVVVALAAFIAQIEGTIVQNRVKEHPWKCLDEWCESYGCQATDKDVVPR